jgi:hypothetical protein
MRTAGRPSAPTLFARRRLPGDAALATIDIYEDFEVELNAVQVELLDVAKMEQQFATLVARGASIDCRAPTTTGPMPRRARWCWSTRTRTRLR